MSLSSGNPAKRKEAVEKMQLSKTEKILFNLCKKLRQGEPIDRVLLFANEYLDVATFNV
jgi:hypothetical protein